MKGYAYYSNYNLLPPDKDDYTFVFVYHKGKTLFEGTYSDYIEIKDNSSENIYKYFDKCSDFIHNALNEKGKIYVHCKQGLSRSPSIVIAYIMKYGICPDISHIRFNEALEYVSKKRPNICPNLGFNLALRDYEKIFFPLTTA